jgi:hypothetical protein
MRAVQSSHGGNGVDFGQQLLTQSQHSQHPATIVATTQPKESLPSDFSTSTLATTLRSLPTGASGADEMGGNRWAQRARGLVQVMKDV